MAVSCQYDYCLCPSRDIVLPQADWCADCSASGHSYIISVPSPFICNSLHSSIRLSSSSVVVQYIYTCFYAPLGADQREGTHRDWRNLDLERQNLYYPLLFAFVVLVIPLLYTSFFSVVSHMPEKNCAGEVICLKSNKWQMFT